MTTTPYYRTKLTLAGTHTPDYVAPDFRQETDTISPRVYGLASAYLLTGTDSVGSLERQHQRATARAR